MDLDLVGSADEDPERTARLMDAWLDRPPPGQPTALVVGAGNGAWYGAEIALARRGRVIGDGEGQFSVVGQAREGLRLAFGAGHAYFDIGFAQLARALGDHLLGPMLAGRRPPGAIVRLRPELRPTQGLELGRIGRFVPHAPGA
jgi:hypothetical protein